MFITEVITNSFCRTQRKRSIDKYQPASIEVKICTYKPADDEYFNLWDTSYLKFWGEMVTLGKTTLYRIGCIYQFL